MTRFYLALVLAGVCFGVYGQKNKPYSEDLSILRPKLPMPEDGTGKVDSSSGARPNNESVKPVKNVNKKVDAVLDSIDRINLGKKYIDGFTVQIYFGQRREEAMSAKNQIATDFPEIVSNLQYQQPKFRVTAGRYLTRLDAQKDLVRLKRHFSGAILVPERLPIK
jgi:hypothetical protein